MVLQRGRDVLVAGQCVEVLLGVVVQRGVVAHLTVDVEGVLEVLLGERIEDHLGRGHMLLLRGGAGAGSAVRGVT